jgi:hypothetical protein
MSGFPKKATILIAALSCICAMVRPAMAQTPVDLQLVLAVDASGSVNMPRFELQKRGYVEAMKNPKVLNAIRSGQTGSIAVTMFQWTGARLQADVIPWMILKDEDTGKAVSDAIAAYPRRLFGGGTSLSGAIDHAMAMFSEGPYRGARQVIDISGDGSNNSGRPDTVARNEAVARGVIINGLPILTVEPDLDDYYRDNVVGGEGSFVIAIKDFEAFSDAIVRKLVAEIASNDPRGGAIRRRF